MRHRPGVAALVVRSCNMTPFVEKLVVDFTAQRPKDDLAEECLVAREAILKFRNTEEGTPDAVGLQGTEVSSADVAALASAVKSFVEACPSHQSVASAIWTLSALDDDSLVPFFLDQIRLHYSERRLYPVQSSDYALCRLGHDAPQYEYAPGENMDEGYWAAVKDFLLRHPKT